MALVWDCNSRGNLDTSKNNSVAGQRGVAAQPPGSADLGTVQVIHPPGLSDRLPALVLPLPPL